MAVAPALPWRATSGEVLRNRLLVPAWIGGLTMLVARAARRARPRRGARLRARRVRDRRHRAPVRARASAAGGRALGESRPVALGRADAVEPAALRRARRAHRRRADRGRARGVVGATARTATCSLATGPVGDRVAATRSRTSARHTARPTQKTSVLGACPGHARAATCSAPTRRASRRSRTAPRGSARRRCTPGSSTTCTSRWCRRRDAQGRVTARRAHQPDDRVALDRRRGSWRSARSSRSRPASAAERPDAPARTADRRRVTAPPEQTAGDRRRAREPVSSGSEPEVAA